MSTAIAPVQALICQPLLAPNVQSLLTFQ